MNSGFLDYIEDGDVILADRGFTIDDILCSKKAKLVIPPFLEKRDAFSLEDERKTNLIAKVIFNILLKYRFNQNKPSGA